MHFQGCLDPFTLKWTVEMHNEGGILGQTFGFWYHYIIGKKKLIIILQHYGTLVL